ncbi:MAG: methyl-accepting chemotaxis protein [Gammaproteobacteria bacterium]|nr:methyl-accepting chemotaxis protein [Gammaproteobacteria bacterium]
MTLRLRLTLMSILATVVVAGVLITTWEFSQQAAHARYVAASVDGKQVLWNKVVESFFEKLLPDMKSVTRDRMLTKALRSKDLVSLRETARTTHNTLASVGHIDRLQIFDLQGDYLASVPEGFSGKTRKQLVMAAANEKNVKQGLDYDEDGKLMAVLAFPVFSRGKIKGVAVYSKGLQTILDDFQHSDQSMVMIKDLNQKSVLAGSDNGDLGFPQADFSAQQDGLEIVQQAGRYHVLVNLPIYNLQGENIAALLTAQDHTDTYATQARLEVISLLAVVGLLLGTSWLTYWYAKRSFCPLDEVVDTMRDISSGDLSTCAAVGRHRHDETGLLTEGMCNMVQHLRSLISEMLSAAGQLTEAAHQLDKNSEAASDQNRQQLHKTQEAARSLAEMTTTIHAIAKNTEAAANATREAGEQVRVGAELVGQVGSSIDVLKGRMDEAEGAVNRLEENGRDISGILDVIRSIADQTGLLALNASIEAARAGEHGRGFAVVADEVRSLANRTQQSTEEIHALIDSLQDGTGQVVALMKSGHQMTGDTVSQVREAETALAEINRAAEQIGDLNTQIASAIEEQSMVASEISNNVVDVEKGGEVAERQTQQVAEAGKDLGTLADKLAGLVGHFRL